MTITIDFKNITLQDLNQVGGKNASLGEMIRSLTQLGIKVPPGFATSADAYRTFLKTNQLEKSIYNTLSNLDVSDVKKLKKASKKIQKEILSGQFSQAFKDAVTESYQALNLKPNEATAVRSSATAEDLPDASFAGQQDTYLNVSGIENILESIKKVYASLFTERAISYRIHHQFSHEEVAISVGIQKMIRSDLASSGVIFTLDTESGFDQVIFITASYGLGETVVQGAVNPDEFYVHKPTLKDGKKSIISRKLGSKEIKMIYGNRGKQRVQTVQVNKEERKQFSLSDDDIITLAKQAQQIENHYGKPMDIEWAKDGLNGELYILQARPETVNSRSDQRVIEHYRLNHEDQTPIIQGRSIGQKIGQGIARIIDNPSHMDSLNEGEVLVADMTTPDWEPIMKKASAIVTNRGGRACHAAIVAREMGIPAVVGCGKATEILPEGKEVTVSCAEGETGNIYEGLLDYEVEKAKIDNLPPLPVKLCMNLANPDQAFTYQFLPNDGIGLARIEFIISNMIGVHPNALLQPDELSIQLQNKIKRLTAAYKNPIEFYVEKLAEGIATIAAAFYPKQVIVRFSDFKSNEYANLLGGRQFEPHEENPMLGYRGGSRYVSSSFENCFALECEAIKRVREIKGLTNTHIMFPFVRTVAEALSLIELTQSNGLTRGENGLKMYMMCEIPSNALLADAFLEHFDGFSIGSNDLTQLALGLDRDSELIANLFDERDEAVKILLHKAISACKKQNKYVGICGQGPSDHEDLAEWLMEEGIESISLTPDSILKTWLALGKKNTLTRKEVQANLFEQSELRNQAD